MSTAHTAASHLIDAFLRERVVTRIWERDIRVWGALPGSADAKSISSRLGWLDVGKTIAPHLDRVMKLGDAARKEGIAAVYLLGMGGSSLCAEVLRTVFGSATGYPELIVLDTTDERTILGAAARLEPARAMFLVASKSGGTLEVASMERLFWTRMFAALGSQAGRHFVAVTDPDTSLQRLAGERGYRELFINPADIGGRFSALSLFGLVPTALIGAPVGELMAGATAMADLCRQENHANAGLTLGAFIGATTKEGRDKLTVVLPPRLASLGLWIEQLVAESTGKHGSGALPVVDEPLGRPDEYGGDRAFVAISTEADAPNREKLDALEAAGHPVLRLTTRVDGLGAEFFRWEFATAIAGAVLGINPFDEPNVSEAKEKTKALLAAFAAHRRIPEPAPAADGDLATVFSRSFAGSSPSEVIRRGVDSLRPGDYIALLSYLPADRDVERAIAAARQEIRSRTRAASTFGVGPRYLHSTGQYHKGGPNTVVACVITADDETATPIPDMDVTFSTLKRAQALGDVEALEAHDRRTVRVHLKRPASAAGDIERLFVEALK
jgi:glucose-6-phosphate isomerase